MIDTFQLTKNRRTVLKLWGMALGVAAIGLPAHADSLDLKAARYLTSPGLGIMVGAGLALPFLEDGKAGSEHALRTAGALATSR